MDPEKAISYTLFPNFWRFALAPATAKCGLDLQKTTSSHALSNAGFNVSSANCTVD
jgi:hypothetical protein